MRKYLIYPRTGGGDDNYIPGDMIPLVDSWNYKKKEITIIWSINNSQKIFYPGESIYLKELNDISTWLI